MIRASASDIMNIRFDRKVVIVSLCKENVMAPVLAKILTVIRELDYFLLLNFL